MTKVPEGQPRPEEELEGEQIYWFEKRPNRLAPNDATMHEIVTHAPLVEQAHAKLEEAISPEDKLAAREALDSALLRTFNEVQRQSDATWKNLRSGRDAFRALMLEQDSEGLVGELSDKKVQELIVEIVDEKRDERAIHYLSGKQILSLPDEELTSLVEFLGRDEKTRWSKFFNLANKVGMAGAERVGAIIDQVYPEDQIQDEEARAKSSDTKLEEEAGIPEDLDDDVEKVEVRQQKLDTKKEAVLRDVFGDEEAKAAIEQMRQKRERQFFSVVKRWNKAHQDLRISKVPRDFQEKEVPIELLAKELLKFIGEQQDELAEKRAEKLLVPFIEREKAMRKEGLAAAAA